MNGISTQFPTGFYTPPAVSGGPAPAPVACLAPSLGGPEESYAGQTLAALPNSASMYAWVANSKQSGSLIDSMVSTRGPGAATPKESEEMRQTLGLVDTGVLRLAQNNGINFGIVRDGSDMTSLGAIRPKSMTDYQAQMPQMRQLADTYNQAGSPFDAKISDLNKKLDALGPGAQSSTVGIDGSNAPETPLQKEASDLNAQIDRLQSDKFDAQNKVFDGKENVLAKPFHPAQPKAEPPPQNGEGTQIYFNSNMTNYQGPRSASMMAGEAGATTPSQLKEYNSLLEGINGDRLKAARTDGLSMYQQAVDGATSPEDKKQALQMLNEQKQHPMDIAIDTKKFNILAPDLQYKKDGNNHDVRLSYHDAQSLMSWSGSKHSKAEPLGLDPGQSDVMGEYYSDSKKVLVRSGTIGLTEYSSSCTPIHELGHGIEDIVSEKAPDFYGGWKKQLDKAYSRVAPNGIGDPPDRIPGETISSYATTNANEYLAEGVANYYQDPKMLQCKDPDLYRLTEQLLEKANSMGNALPQ